MEIGNIATYILIFLAKLIENALGTLRLIIVANGKKHTGAILAFIIALIWVIALGVVVVDINNDWIKILVFAFGTYVGSYLGSTLEEKIAIGNNLLIIISNNSLGPVIVKKLRNKNFAVTVLEGDGKDSTKYILMILVSRKKQDEIVKYVKEIDNDAMIMCESADTIMGGHYHNSKNKKYF